MLATIAIQVITPLLSIIATAIAPLIVVAIVRFFNKLGIEVEAKHREALQSALRNAALVTVQKALERGVDGNLTSIEAIKGPALDYIRNSVPDAVKKFKLDDARIKQLLEPHFAEVLLKKTDR
jgi:hypothetical protein